MYGRGFEQLLPATILSELANTYVALDVEETWAALDCLIRLFRQVASDVGNALGYSYPQQVDEQVSAFLHEIRELPQQ